MSSDAEMVTPPASKRKGNSSAPSKATSKKSKKEATPEEEPEDGAPEDEEYEIEEILDCKKGMFAPNRWAFFVSWKGYGKDDNSWVDEPDFFAKDMIERWWIENPQIKGNPLSGKKSKGRKSEGASSKAKSSRKGDDSEDEGDSKSSVSKRKSTNIKKRASEEVDETPDVVDEEEEERPKKKSRTSTKKKQESPQAENGYFDEAGEVSGLDEHVWDAMAKHMNKKSWEKLIKSIETVERQEDGVLLVYYTSTDGIRAISDSKVLAEKAPQKLIEFYEGHLRWRGAGN